MTRDYDRRRFIVTSSAAVAGSAACVCGVGGCATLTGVGDTPDIPKGAYDVADGPVVTVALGDVPQLATVGGAVKIIDSTLPLPLIIARTGDESYVAAALSCAHRGVEVEYDHPNSHLVCASLGSSTYGLDGKRVSGPTEKDLAVFAATVAEGTLTVQL